MWPTLILSGVAILTATSQETKPSDDAPEIWRYLANRYDQNKDGAIDPKEYDRGTEKFAAYDQDKDGKLTEKDFASTDEGRRGRGGRGGRGADMRSRITPRVAQAGDKDGDGSVTEAEWNALLESLGADEKTGVISSEAITKLVFGDRTGGDRGRGRGGRRGLDPTQALDQDGDGKLTLAEVEGIFEELDRDENGTLESAEMNTRGRRNGGGRGRGAREAAPEGPPQKGDLAPDFELPIKPAKEGATLENFKLSSLKGDKPVALIFGSYT